MYRTSTLSCGSADGSWADSLKEQWETLGVPQTQAALCNGERSPMIEHAEQEPPVPPGNLRKVGELGDNMAWVITYGDMNEDT